MKSEWTALLNEKKGVFKSGDKERLRSVQRSWRGREARAATSVSETRTGRMSESSGDLTATSPYPTHQSPDPTTLTCHTAPSTLCHVNPHVDEYAWVLTSATNWTGHTTQMSCTRRTKVASTCWEDWGPLLKLFMTQQTSRDGWLRLDCTLNSIWGWKRAGC